MGRQVGPHGRQPELEEGTEDSGLLSLVSGALEDLIYLCGEGGLYRKEVGKGWRCIK